MKNIPFLFFSFLSVLHLNAQWEATDGPRARSYVMDIKELNSTLFASTPCGVFVQRPAASNWERISYSHTPQMFINGDSVFTSFYHGLGIIDINDPSLNEIQNPYLGSPFINGPSLAFKDSLMLINSFEGIHISLDWGLSTQTYNTGLDMDTLVNGGTTYYMLRVTDVVSTPSYFYCSTEKGIYRSDHQLGGWQKMNTGIGTGLIRKLYSTNGDLYAMTIDTLYRSTDSGQSWSSILGRKYLHDVCMMGNTIYVAADTSGILYSSNHGGLWQIAKPGQGSASFYGVEFTGNKLFAMSSNNGMYQLTNGVWKLEKTEGMFCTYLTGVRSTGQSVVATEWNGVYRKNQDDTWDTISPISTSGYGYSKPYVYNDTLFVCGKRYNPQNWVDSAYGFYTADGGNNWQSIPVPQIHQGSSLIKFKHINGVLYFMTEDWIFSSTDFGQTWGDITPTLNCLRIHNIHDIAQFNGETFLSTCHPNLLYRFDTGLSSWVAGHPVSGSGNELEELMATDSALFVRSGNSIFRRFKGSTVWKKISGTLTPSDIEDWVEVDRNIFVVNGLDIYRTEDYGDTWHSFRKNLQPQLRPVGIDVYNDTLYLATTEHGVFKHDATGPLGLWELTTEEASLKIFPNPASGSVFIDIPNQTDGVYRIVTTNGGVLKAGSFETAAPINLQGLPGGLYIVLIEVDGNQYQEKLIIE